MANKVNAKVFVDNSYTTTESQETVLHQDSSRREGGKSGKKGKDKEKDKNAAPNSGKNSRERVYVADGMPSESKGCPLCHGPGHPKSLCPVEAAKKRGEIETLIAESNAKGGFCSICQEIGLKAKDHRARHHVLAAQDLYAIQGGDKKGGGKGESKGGKRYRQGYHHVSWKHGFIKRF